MNAPTVRYLKNNFDAVAILSCLVDLSFKSGFELNEENQAILAALRRSSEDFKYASVEEIGNRLSGYDDAQIAGLVSNVKGKAHEMQFVNMENEDGDSIYASLYPAPNHPDFDVQLIDTDTGESWDVQLKASDDTSYVEKWIEENPDGEIMVTEELAEEMDLGGSGVENAPMTAQVEKFVDKLIEHDDVQTLSSYFPMLVPASVAIVIWELWQRYQQGELPYKDFKVLAVMVAGKKTIKIGALLILLSIPAVNVVVGAALVAQIIYSTTELASGYLDTKKLAKP